jgi:uncharacterized RDD family membrane protein YckC
MNLSTTLERILAALLDAAILVPILEIILRFIPASTAIFFIVSLLIYAILYVGYAVVFNWKFGGTIGKILVGLRVKSIDGSPISLNQAFRRSSVDLMFQLIQIGEFYILINRGQIDKLPDVSISAMRAAIDEQRNLFTSVMLYVEIAWLLSEFVTMQFNAKKRALHDFIAGTIVLTDFRRRNGIKALLWVFGILSLTLFAVFLVSTGDDTTGKIQMESSLWSAKSSEEIRSILKDHKVSPNKVNAFEQNILHVAVRNSDTRNFSIFLQTFPELINSPDYFGDTPSHTAHRFSSDKYEIIKKTGLLEKKFNRFGEANIQ